ncbi:MAG: chorismate mutase [Pseudomonadota bacterium]
MPERKKERKQDNNKDNQLLQLRSKIDNIDNKLIDLLNQRMEVIREVGDYKKSINENFFIKSAREADMIKTLLKKADPSIPKSTIVSIWRKIITSANVLEQKLTIAVHNPDKIVDYQYLIREYYGDFVPLIFHDSATYIIAEIEKRECQIGIFALPDKGQNKIENWWINLANNQSGIKVFARIPLIGNSPYQLVAVAIKPPEKSEDDQTLLTIEVASEFSKYQVDEALNATKLKFKILQSAKLDQIQNVNFYLIEIDGFFEEQSPEIIQFSHSQIKPFVKVLGHFAKPII